MHLRTVIELLTELTTLHTTRYRPNSKGELFRAFAQYVPIIKDAIRNMKRHKMVENDDVAVFYKLSCEAVLFAGEYMYAKVRARRHCW